MKKSFKERLKELGLSYKKEIAIITMMNVVILAATLVGYFYLKNLLLFVGGFGLLGVANFMYLSRYSGLEKQLEKERSNEFITLLSYFEMFISNGKNVYTALRMLIPYSTDFTKKGLDVLLEQIDIDKSVEPFINFARLYKNNTFEYLMISIYQMVDAGGDTTRLKEFNFLFSSISKKNQEMMIEEKKRSLDALSSWPLFGAGAMTIILSISLLGVIGAYINVL